jgi:hypothetical protein
MSISREVIEKLTQRWADQGKLVEAGFVAFKYAVMSPDAPDIQVQEMRLAFMAGAQHLFTSIIAMLDADADPTSDDIARMSMIDKELRAFVAECEAGGRH